MFDRAAVEDAAIFRHRHRQGCFCLSGCFRTAPYLWTCRKTRPPLLVVLLEVEHLSHNCAVGEEAMHQLNRPVEVNARTGVVAPPGLVSSPALRFRQSRATRTTRGAHWANAPRYHSGQNDLRPAATPSTRHDRKDPQNPPLPSHPVRAPRGAVLHPRPRPSLTVPRWPKPRPTALHQVLASATSFKNSKRRSTTTSRSLNSSAKNLTQSQQVLKFKSSRAGDSGNPSLLSPPPATTRFLSAAPHPPRRLRSGKQPAGSLHTPERCDKALRFSSNDQAS